MTLKSNQFSPDGAYMFVKFGENLISFSPDGAYMCVKFGENCSRILNCTGWPKKLAPFFVLFNYTKY